MTAHNLLYPYVIRVCSVAAPTAAGVRSITSATTTGVAEGRLHVSATRGQGRLRSPDAPSAHPAAADGGTDSGHQTSPVPEVSERR